MSKLKLQLELIPESQWGQSLANKLPTYVWKWFRTKVYQRFNYTCVLCGATGVEVHCHEVWHWDDKKKLQILAGAQCLCKNCHRIKHWGGTIAEFHKGRLTAEYIQELTDHFCKVNECTPLEFEAHKLEMREVYARRSKKSYKIMWGKWSPLELEKKWRQEN